MNDSQKTEQILALLLERHAPPEWAAFAEMRSSTGWSTSLRSFDLWAMNLWPSNRFLKVAYEIKVSRADFARELQKPDKRREAESVSNECYFATPVGLVRPDEVPEGWGLIELTKGGMRIKKRAMQREVKELSMGFVASIARRTAGDAPKFPASAWLYAGQELDREKLIEVAGKVLDRSLHTERAKAVSEFKQSDGYRKLAKLYEVVQLKVGYRYGDPDNLLEYLEQLKNGVDTGVPHEMRSKLQRMQANIRALERDILTFLSQTT